MPRSTRFTAPLLALVLALASCSSDSTTAPRQSAAITLTSSANPVTATVSTDGVYDWMVEVTLTVTESAGVSAEIETAEIALAEASGGVLTTTVSSNNFRVVLDAPVTTVDALGSVSFDVTVFYRLPNGGREALLDASVAIVDANGNRLTKFMGAISVL